MSNNIFDALNKFAKQDYDKLKSKCDRNNLFVDNLFPANDRSLWVSRSRIANVVWKRPHEIVQSPKLVSGGASSRDVNQGRLGNCWFVAAVSVLASEKKFWNKVVPDAESQEIASKNYCGIFKFRFWQFGKWIEIVIDDLLPTVNGRLIFTHSNQRDEFWSSLLEKAYAKWGSLSESLQDFTGGVCESIQLDRGETWNENLFEAMKKAYERNSLMACAINAKSSHEMEQKMACGLVKGHAYGITKVSTLTLNGNSFFSFLSKEKLHMIRLKNPWGAQEWLGPWSDKSPEWKRVPKSEREKMGLNFDDDDGEFWMEFGDFLRYFNEVCICRIINTSMLTIRKTWSESKTYGRWSLPDRAGGCVNNRDTFCDNPQYIFVIDGEPNKSEDVLISLDQLSLRLTGKDNLTIGFFIMRVEDNRKYRLHQPKPKAASSTFINTRSVFLRHKLPTGHYVVIPSTFDRNIQGHFLLRIYTDEPSHLSELIKDCPTPMRCNPFSKYASCVTSIKVCSGSNLTLNGSGRDKFDSYVRIKCEDKQVVGKVFKNSNNPEWNTSAIFYRYRQNKPIRIEIFISNTFRDQYYGQATIKAEPDNRHVLLDCNIITNPDSNIRNPGRIQLEIQSMTNIKSI